MTKPSSLVQLVVDSTSAVAFTGAGISTEAGIPDFRSPGGLWAGRMPIHFDDFCRSAEMRREAWRRKFAMDATFAAARPGRGHRAIAHLARTGRVSHVITQNIDNMHQLAGVPAEQVIELHGNGARAACLDCRATYDLAWIRSELEQHGDAPDCPDCGGLIKSATISFGQPMPEHELARAEAAAQACDLFIVIGSSLVVYPAAALPLVAKRNGARLAIVNREPTDLDPVADLVIRDDIATVLDPLAGLN